MPLLTFSSHGGFLSKTALKSLKITLQISKDDQCFRSFNAWWPQLVNNQAKAHAALMKQSKPRSSWRAWPPIAVTAPFSGRIGIYDAWGVINFQVRINVAPGEVVLSPGRFNHQPRHLDDGSWGEGLSILPNLPVKMGRLQRWGHGWVVLKAQQGHVLRVSWLEGWHRAAFLESTINSSWKSPLGTALGLLPRKQVPG